MATYNEIADYFISLSNSTGNLITNLKLQKLVYYAQAWNLAVNKEEIFNEDFQAWVHGPVLPRLYEQYKELKWKPIIREDLGDDSLQRLIISFPIHLNEVLTDVVEEYFSMDAYALEKSTHEELPWREARKGLPADAPSTEAIKKETMQKYYGQFVNAV